MQDNPAGNSTLHRFAMPILLAIAGLAFAARSFAQIVEPSQVEAAYLYNFAKFVEWPPATFPDPAGPAMICVVGDQRVSAVLTQAVVGKKVNGRPVEVREPQSSKEFKLCHILFIAFTDKEHIGETLKGLRGLGVLTVGQSDQFIALGGMINLTLKNSRIELEIDPEASDAVGLKISSRLLVVARLVKIRHPEGAER